jgi:hypothetical protein
MLSTIWLVLIVSVSLYCLNAYIKPLEGERNPRKLLAGILGLADAAFYLHATYSLIFVHLPHSAIIFRTFRGMVGGMWVSTLIPTGFGRGARSLLILSGFLFVGSPLALVSMLYLRSISPSAALHAMFTSLSILPLEALPVGLAIPAIVLLLRSGRNDSKSTGNDSGLTAAEHTVENGNEA